MTTTTLVQVNANWNGSANTPDPLYFYLLSFFDHTSLFVVYLII